MTKTDEIVIHTDGSCLGNPGPGGYAAILASGGKEKEITRGYRLTTNNRMELLAVIKALESLKRPCKVTLHTDSQYVMRAITEGWLKNWIKRGWRTAAGKPTKNVDLWKRLRPLLDEHDVDFRWVRGHCGHSENERADDLARAAAMGDDLAVDEVFEAESRA